MNFYDAFISYGRADSKAFAINLNEKLTAAGLNVWFDQNDIPPAVDYQKQIDDGIEKAHNFLFIIAPHSVNSPYCLKEIELAIKLNKRIIPLLQVEQISHEIWQQRNPNKTEEDWQEYQQKGLHSSYGNMHPAISKINWIRFADNLDDFSTYFDGLLNAINKQQDYVEQHTNFLVQALEWSRNQQQTNYFLVGEERGKAEQWLKQRFIEEQPPCIPTDLHCEFICESIKNSHNLLSQVFLAAADKDEVIKEKIRKTLMRESVTVWTNKTDIKTGTAFPEAITQGIEGADNFIYLISLDSLKSEYCQQELNQALANNKRIIPLLITETDFKLIPLELKKLQFIDFTQSESETEYRFSADKLLQELKKEPFYYEKHKILLVKAQKWKRQNENPSLLLHGYNLQHFEAWLKVAKQREDYPSLPLQEEFIIASLNQSEASSLEVFISYSRTDSDLARKINDALQELGKTTWFDQESIATGTDFQQEINRGIASSDNFLFIISPKSVNSPYCASEVEYAKNLGKRFITVLHRPLSDDDKQKLPAALASVQWLDFNHHGGEFSANFNELVRTLDTDRDHVRSHTKWSQRALEWDEKGKNADLLLRGSEFAIAEEWLEISEIEKKNPPITDLQKDFIIQSWQAIEARKRQEKRQILILRSLLLGTSMALIAAILGGIFGWRERKQSELIQAQSLTEYSFFLLREHKELDASIQGIKAGKILLNQQMSDLDSPVLNVMKVLDLALNQGREKNSLEDHDGRVLSISFSPDGKTLASGGLDYSIRLWNVETGKKISTIPLDGGTIKSLSFSPNGKTLAFGGNDQTIKLWDVKIGKEIKTFNGRHLDTVNGLSFSPDGKILASGSDDQTIKLWDVETGKEISTFKGHTGGIMDVSFSPDGKILASGSDDQTIKLWDVNTGKETRTPLKHTEPVFTVAFSRDGKTLASGGKDKKITLWDLKTGKKSHTLEGHDNYVYSLDFGSDGKTLASSSSDNTIKLWNLKTHKPIETLYGHDDTVKQVRFSPGGKILASGSWDSTIKLWDLAKELTPSLQGHDSSVYNVSFSPDRNTVASGSSDDTIKLWNVKTRQEIGTLKGHEKAVNSVRFSPDGKTLASGSDDKTIKLWNVETRQEIGTLKGHKGVVNSVNFSPDGKTLASGGADNTIKLWNVETRQEIGTLKGHKGVVNSVNFSPDGKTLASGGADNTIKLWNVETRQEIGTLKGHKGVVNSVNFSPDGKTLASGGADNIIKLWNVETRQENNAFTGKGHEKAVNSVRFSPDGKTLASGSLDKTIKFWNVKTGKEIPILRTHQSGVYSVNFSPDGKTLASGSDDKTIKLWNVPPNNNYEKLDDLMKKSCNWIRNYLQNNPQVSKRDQHLCDGIGTQQ
ncbi:MAG: TIR domain-containing protein [Aphanizomenon flos-aquae Clear-A1]|nr:TIR domain-containing protein [Aphanizomenon flos-aquae Clear-A1]